MTQPETSNKNNTVRVQNLARNSRDYRGSFPVWFLSFIGLIAIDQLVKIFIFSHPDHFPIVPFRNYLFAFSLPITGIIAYIIYAGVIAWCVFYCIRNYKQFYLIHAIAWLFIFAGAFSNIGERLINGYVKDYLYILSGIFNLADGYIVAGIIILLCTTPKTHKN